VKGQQPASGPQTALSSADAARLSQAFGFLQRGHIAEAKTITDELTSRLPDSADAQHMLALCRKATGDIAGAVAAFEAAWSRNPDDANLLGNYANLLSRIDRTRDAIGLYRRALTLAPGHGQTWLNFGLALNRASDPAGACTALESAVALLPGSSPAWPGSWLGTACGRGPGWGGDRIAARRRTRLTQRSRLDEPRRRATPAR
jgi:Tfp pilus assembly protein PilF